MGGYPVRNITLDYFRLLLAFLVVAIHVNTFKLGVYGWFISEGISRIAVPSFLLINGYYLAPIIGDVKKVGKYLVHLLILLLVWSLIYFPIAYYTQPGIGISALMLQVGNGLLHLWYIVALLGATVLLYFMAKVNDKVVLAFSVLLFFIGVLLQSIDNISEVELSVYCSRNFLFFGFPFVFVGYYIHKKEFQKTVFAQSGVLYLLTFILLVVLLVESWLSYKMGAQRGDFYFSLIFLCPLLFLSVLKNSQYKSDDGYIAKLSSGVYFIHILVMYLMQGFSYLEYVILYPTVLFLSLLAAVPLVELNKRLKVFL